MSKPVFSIITLSFDNLNYTKKFEQLLSQITEDDKQLNLDFEAAKRKCKEKG